MIRGSRLPIILVATASNVAAFGQSPTFQRWAILTTQSIQESGLADLLTVELGKEPELTLVERDQLTAVTMEMALDHALGADAAGERLKLGTLLKADALLLPSEEHHEKDRFIRVVSSDAALGARPVADFLRYNPGEADKLAGQIVMLVRETRSRFPQGVQRIIGVPSFVSRDLTHDFNYLQDQLAYVLQNGLAAWPEQAVLEVEEARAIQRELDTAGDKLARRVVPCFIEGEYRTTPTTALTTQPAMLMTASASAGGHRPDAGGQGCERRDGPQSAR